jgi:hypothetical protein
LVLGGARGDGLEPGPCKRRGDELAVLAMPAASGLSMTLHIRV